MINYSRTDLSREGLEVSSFWLNDQTKALTHTACGSRRPGMRILMPWEGSWDGNYAPQPGGFLPTFY